MLIALDFTTPQPDGVNVSLRNSAGLTWDAPSKSYVANPAAPSIPMVTFASDAQPIAFVVEIPNVPVVVKPGDAILFFRDAKTGLPAAAPYTVPVAPVSTVNVGSVVVTTIIQGA